MIRCRADKLQRSWLNVLIQLFINRNVNNMNVNKDNDMQSIIFQLFFFVGSSKYQNKTSQFALFSTDDVFLSVLR